MKSSAKSLKNESLPDEDGPTKGEEEEEDDAEEESSMGPVESALFGLLGLKACSASQTQHPDLNSDSILRSSLLWTTRYKLRR